MAYPQPCDLPEPGREELAGLTLAAARFFAARLAGSWVPGYLARRGFGEQAWRGWTVGYAPGAWTALAHHLRDLGYTDGAIVATGLARRTGRGALVDVFRDRIMFGIRLPGGTVAGFTGRARPGHPPPVYLNTRTSVLYRKRSVLFGLYEGRRALAAGARAVLVEGPLDAIAVTAAGPGRYAGVSPCGTALTAAQVALLARVSDLRRAGVVVAFDGDRAGRRAAVRAYRLLRDQTDQVTTVAFPAGQDETGQDEAGQDWAGQDEAGQDRPGQSRAGQEPAGQDRGGQDRGGQDPAGFRREHGGRALARLLDTSAPLADLVADETMTAFERWLDFPDGKFAALRAVAPLVAGLPAGQVARQVARVAGRLGLSYAEVTEAVTRALE